MANNEEVKEEKVLTKKELKEQAKLEKQKEKEKQQKLNAKKEKKPGLFKKIKESWGELKKVTWPTFANVVKKTGVVILVVVLFTVVLFGIEYGLGSLYKLLLG
jgi:preprotein translocase subunit SecE